MVGATGAEIGEFLCVRGVDELQHVGRVAEAGNPAVLRADAAAQIGRNLESQELCAIGARRNGFAAEADCALCFAVARDELADLVDDGEGVQVALALRLAPGEEAVAAQHDAVAAGIVAHAPGAS